MLNSPVVLFFSSRAISAAGALLAALIFTRLAGAVEYGQYLLIFAWGTIVFGLSSQWMIWAFFGVYNSKQLDAFAASLFELLVVSLAIVAVGFIAIWFLGYCEPKFLIAIFAMIVGMATYLSVFDVARTKFKSRSAALSMILRASLIVFLGTLVLWKGGGAIGLAITIMVAHLIASVPCWIAAGGIHISQRSRGASLEVLRYGWPLMLSFGILALGQNIDRIILVHYLGIAKLGAYGVISELMRQCFAVFGEVILFSMITSAKQLSIDGKTEDRNRMLRTAFNACVATGTFGAAFFIVFGDRVLRLLLAPEFHDDIGNLVPIFAIAYGFTAIGQYYFANVIYFTNASYLGVISSTVLFIVSSTLSIFLVPRFGPQGAAMAMLVAIVASYTALIVISRRCFCMPIDLAGAIGISRFPAIFVFVVWLLGRFSSNTIFLRISEALVLVAIGVYVVQRYELLGPMKIKLINRSEKTATS